MKFKKVLLTILIALVAIILLQAQVNAEEVDYSEYDYLLTEGGVIAQENLTETDTVIAGIKGEYTGTIEVNLKDNEIELTNFNADALDIDLEYEIGTFYINGENSINYINIIRRSWRRCWNIFSCLWRWKFNF